MAAFRQTAMLRVTVINPLRLWGAPPRLSAQRTFASGSTHGGPQGQLEHALLLKNKIGSAEAEELESCGDLIAKHCERIEETIGQVSERHANVSRAMRSLGWKYLCTCVVIGSIQRIIDAYYYDKAGFEFEERQQRAAEVE